MYPSYHKVSLAFLDIIRPARKEYKSLQYSRPLLQDLQYADISCYFERPLHRQCQGLALSNREACH